jgi:hypothetical protein
MVQILKTEDHVAIPPMMYSDPFYRITYLIKEEIRKYKWIEGEKGRLLSWQQARAEWTEAHREEYEKFLLDTLSFPVTGKLSTETENQSQRAEDSAEAQEDIARTGARLSKLPHRPSG